VEERRGGGEGGLRSASGRRRRGEELVKNCRISGTLKLGSVDLLRAFVWVRRVKGSAKLIIILDTGGCGFCGVILIDRLWKDGVRDFARNGGRQLSEGGFIVIIQMAMEKGLCLRIY